MVNFTLSLFLADLIFVSLLYEVWLTDLKVFVICKHDPYNRLCLRSSQRWTDYRTPGPPFILMVC